MSRPLGAAIRAWVTQAIPVPPIVASKSPLDLRGSGVKGKTM
jgi:hypothetical protein